MFSEKFGESRQLYFQKIRAILVFCEYYSFWFHIFTFYFILTFIKSSCLASLEARGVLYR